MVWAIVSWCDALNGSLSLRDGFADLIAGLSAEAGLLVRTNMHDLRPVRIAAADRAQACPGLRPQHRSFADSYFGAAMASARTGTIWIASDHADDCTGEPSLWEWQASRKMKEFVVLVLSAGGTMRDHVELHFRNRLTEAEKSALVSFFPVMVRVWAGRKTGLITRTIVNKRVPEFQGKAGKSMVRTQAILSAENPAQLSRSEFRVCLLLSRGLHVNAVAFELNLSEPTIRTHLRSIYAKTETGSLAELVFHLIDDNSKPGTATQRYA